MKIKKTMLICLTIMSLSLAGCGKDINKDLLQKTVFDYTEHLHREVEKGSAPNEDVVALSYYGNATARTKDSTWIDGDDSVLFDMFAVTRLDEKQENLCALLILGDLDNNILSIINPSFVIYSVYAVSVSIKTGSYKLVYLDNISSIPDGLLTVYWDTYLELLEELTYADMKYAVNTLYDRNY